MILNGTHKHKFYANYVNIRSGSIYDGIVTSFVFMWVVFTDIGFYFT
jgi:hypothetical protein